MKCACCSNKEYSNCCALPHQQLIIAKTAEQLMRSRYTAFTMANGDYLLLSHHSTTRPNNEIEEIVAWAKSVKWLRLEVIMSKEGKETDIEGVVEFKAFYKEGYKTKYIHEVSKFIKEHGCWTYISEV
jgi:SEC-C motif-containing protein